MVVCGGLCVCVYMHVRVCVCVREREREREKERERVWREGAGGVGGLNGGGRTFVRVSRGPLINLTAAAYTEARVFTLSRTSSAFHPARQSYTASRPYQRYIFAHLAEQPLPYAHIHVHALLFTDKNICIVKHTHTHTRIYIYIYIYICECLCVSTPMLTSRRPI